MFRENKVTKEIRSRIKNRWPIVGPDHVHRYFLEEFPRFNEGKNAVVYQANDTQTLESVAIKILPKKHPLENEKKLVNEAMRLKKLKGKRGIPKFVDYFISQSHKHDQSPVIVMEFIEGESLNDKINQKSLTKEELIRAVIQTAKIIEQLDFPVDLKPEHIKLTEPFITLLDLGDDYTMEFSAPERIRGEINATTNQFALAALCKYALTGNKIKILGTDPKKTTTKFEEFTNWNLKHQFKDLNILELNAIFKKALSNNIEDRFSSAFEFACVFANVMKDSKGPNRSIQHTIYEFINP